MSFRVGQEVVCIDDIPKWGASPWEPEEAIFKGQVYTITSIHADTDGFTVFWLAEVARCKKAVAIHGPMAGYDAKRFRPVVKPTHKASTETGMTILHKIRMGGKVTEDA